MSTKKVKQVENLPALPCLGGSRKLTADKRMADGLCRDCKKPQIAYSNTYCAIHYVIDISSGAIGVRSKDVALRLLEKLEKQDFICPYTGDKLVLGLNAQIDHINPRSRFPELISNLENLEWVSKRANLAKGDMTKEEFIEFCRLIISRV